MKKENYHKFKTKRAKYLEAARIAQQKRKERFAKWEKFLGKKIISKLRFMAKQEIYFVGAYHDNEARAREWCLNRNVIVLKKVQADIPFKKLSYHGNDTEAQNKMRKLTLWFVNENFYTTNILGFDKTVEHIKLGLPY